MTFMRKFQTAAPETFVKTIEGLRYDFDAMDYLKKFENGPVNNVEVKIIYTTIDEENNRRDAKITFTPVTGEAFTVADKEFRTLLSKLNPAGLTAANSTKIRAEYERFIKFHNLSSEHEVKIQKTFGNDAGSAY